MPDSPVPGPPTARSRRATSSLFSPVISAPVSMSALKRGVLWCATHFITSSTLHFSPAATHVESSSTFVRFRSVRVRIILAFEPRSIISTTRFGFSFAGSIALGVPENPKQDPKRVPPPRSTPLALSFAGRCGVHRGKTKTARYVCTSSGRWRIARQTSETSSSLAASMRSSVGTESGSTDSPNSSTAASNRSVNVSCCFFFVFPASDSPRSVEARAVRASAASSRLFKSERAIAFHSSHCCQCFRSSISPNSNASASLR